MQPRNENGGEEEIMHSHIYVYIIWYGLFVSYCVIGKWMQSDYQHNILLLYAVISTMLALTFNQACSIDTHNACQYIHRVAILRVTFAVIV